MRIVPPTLKLPDFAAFADRERLSGLWAAEPDIRALLSHDNRPSAHIMARRWRESWILD
jgi:hypothetical protein